MLRNLLRAIFRAEDGRTRALPGSAEFLLRGQHAMEASQLEEAERIADAALASAPDDKAEAQAFCMRAEVRRRRRNMIGALADYDCALNLNASSSAIRLKQSWVFHHLGRFEEALAAVEAALYIEPCLPVAHYNRGIMLRELGKLDESEASLRHALQLEGTYLDARAKLALVLTEQGRLDEAECELFDVLAADKRHVDARWHLANVHLLRGNFAAAWPDYESRLERSDAYLRPYSFPRWDGSPLGDGGLLVYAEQGLGDEILFASCFQDAVSRVRHCVIECEPRLVGLFARSFPRARVVGSKYQSAPDWVAEEPLIAAQIPAGSLPRLFRNGDGDFPAHAGYLSADPARVAAWRARLEALGGGIKVGIAWTGGSLKTRRAIRSLALARWLPILRAIDAQFVSLQHIDSTEEIAELVRQHGLNVHHFPEAIADYDDTANLVCALDLVISVTTAVVHLAGALGKPVWVMVPASPEWRYQLNADTIPWYPSMRLFRQGTLGDWQRVIERVACQLRRWVHEPHTSGEH